MNKPPTAKKKPSNSKAISVWFDKDLHSKVKKRAKAQGRSVSNHLRWLVTEDCKQAAGV